MIEIRNVKYKYSEEMPRYALNGINLTLQEGEFTAILGHNGSGKSTLAKLLNGILQPTEGEIVVDGISTSEEDKAWDIRTRVGMVFQNPDNQIVATIVEEDVAFGPENLGVPTEEIIQRVDFALKAVGMEQFRKAAPHNLSGGQKQRIAIAGIIAMMPKYIVLDEPTAMLDPAGRKEVMKTIQYLNKEYKMSVILITHYMDEAAMADRVIVMDQGEVIIDDIPSMTFASVALLKSVGLDVPQVTDLMFQLRRAGLFVRHDLLTVEQCADELEKLRQA